MVWTVKAAEETCGGCGQRIAGGTAFGLVSSARKPRCGECVQRLGLGPVDWDEVNAAMAALERARARKAPPALRAPVADPPAVVAAPAKKPIAKVLPFEEVAGKVPEERW